MELSEPSIAAGLAAALKLARLTSPFFPTCFRRDVIRRRNIPAMVAEAAEAHPGVTFSVTPGSQLT